MKNLFQNYRFLVSSLTVIFLALSSGPVMAETAQQIDSEVDVALQKLYASTPVAKKLAAEAEAVLVFPSMLKAGLMVGGQYGKGALRQKGKTVGYYRSSAVSYGLQAGAQKFGYAMFFMSSDALKYLGSSDGWEVGVGPSIVMVDEGMARTMTTTTLNDGVYAFVFGQKGLMAGIGLQGSKIDKINPGK